VNPSSPHPQRRRHGVKPIGQEGQEATFGPSAAAWLRSAGVASRAPRFLPPATNGRIAVAAAPPMLPQRPLRSPKQSRSSQTRPTRVWSSACPKSPRPKDPLEVWTAYTESSIMPVSTSRPNRGGGARRWTRGCLKGDAWFLRCGLKERGRLDRCGPRFRCSRDHDSCRCAGSPSLVATCDGADASIPTTRSMAWHLRQGLRSYLISDPAKFWVTPKGYEW
jgi:hypothetical protein